MTDHEFLELHHSAGRNTKVALGLFLLSLVLLVTRMSAVLWIATLGAAVLFRLCVQQPTRARYAEEVLRRKVVAARKLNA